MSNIEFDGIKIDAEVVRRKLKEHDAKASKPEFRLGYDGSLHIAVLNGSSITIECTGDVRHWGRGTVRDVIDALQKCLRWQKED
jgi:hypothetical protein